jgi:UDP-glucuronate 4-epimerase
MRILITGHCGFIGGHICDDLWKKHELIGYDIRQGDDICNKRDLEFIFETENIDCVIHLAALTGARRGELYPDDYFKVNVLGTKNVIDLCEKYGVKKLIHFSSSSAIKPDTIYGMSKYVGELLAGRCKVPAVSIIRPFTVIGHDGRKDQVIYKWLGMIKANRPIELHGYETNRNFTWVGDIVNFIKKLIDTGFENSPCLFELCNPNSITLDEMQQIFRHHFSDLKVEDVGLSEYEMFENKGRWDSPLPATDVKKIIDKIIKSNK